MFLMETKDIKKPKSVDKVAEASLEFQSRIEELENERNNLTNALKNAKERILNIPVEIEQQQRKLSKTLDKAERKKLKDTIIALETELQESREILDIDIKAIMMSKFAESNVYSLEEASREEQARIKKDIAEYERKLKEVYLETLSNISRIRDRSIYNRTKLRLDNLERSLMKYDTDEAKERTDSWVNWGS